ncbi:MAG: DUF2231 domain-containing protein [Gammaproteobacteria bacterium]
MRPPRKAFGVPLHPILVHFPVAFWVTVPVLDVVALHAGPEPWWTLALDATLAGIAIGALAIATGILEYLEPSVVGIDMRLAARHGTRTTLAWCMFTAKTILATALPPIAGWGIALCLALDLTGCALLLQGVYYGTKQVYEQLDRL